MGTVGGGALRRREKEAHATHWPPALAIPQELEEDEAAAPEQFKCPITLAIMTEPALTPNGEALKCSLACPSCATDASVCANRESAVQALTILELTGVHLQE